MKIAQVHLYETYHRHSCSGTRTFNETWTKWRKLWRFEARLPQRACRGAKRFGKTFHEAAIPRQTEEQLHTITALHQLVRCTNSESCFWGVMCIYIYIYYIYILRRVYIYVKSLSLVSNSCMYISAAAGNSCARGARKTVTAPNGCAAPGGATALILVAEPHRGPVKDVNG